MIVHYFRMNISQHIRFQGFTYSKVNLPTSAVFPFPRAPPGHWHGSVNTGISTIGKLEWEYIFLTSEPQALEVTLYQKITTVAGSKI